ncbi:hypothetical protein J1N35_000475 [Gossypium stocksii]|uniref:Uncharacterized protein n=1 Tax=Gossypium stocksii TaxID=47602 RepID=A0A9D3WH52_9ROSI|nr:hypothetical protein J1N35_000475 [Gossypium stocksii]
MKNMKVKLVESEGKVVSEREEANENRVAWRWSTAVGWRLWKSRNVFAFTGVSSSGAEIVSLSLGWARCLLQGRSRDRAISGGLKVIQW